jgi:hypothetical protein
VTHSESLVGVPELGVSVCGGELVLIPGLSGDPYQLFTCSVCGVIVSRGRGVTVGVYSGGVALLLRGLVGSLRFSSRKWG